MLRGLSSRATRIRRPTRGAASMKKAMSAATAATGTLGTRPPNAPKPAVSDEGGWPNGDSGPCARRGGADCALGGFAVGFERGPLGEPSGRCQAIGAVVRSGVVDSVPRCPGASCPPSGIRSATGAVVRDVSAGTITTDTSTPEMSSRGQRELRKRRQQSSGFHEDRDVHYDRRHERPCLKRQPLWQRHIERLWQRHIEREHRSLRRRR